MYTGHSYRTGSKSIRLHLATKLIVHWQLIVGTLQKTLGTIQRASSDTWQCRSLLTQAENLGFITFSLRSWMLKYTITARITAYCMHITFFTNGKSKSDFIGLHLTPELCQIFPAPPKVLGGSGSMQRQTSLSLMVSMLVK